MATLVSLGSLGLEDNGYGNPGLGVRVWLVLVV